MLPLALLFVFILASPSDARVFVPRRSDRGGTEAVLIFIQGAQVDADKYNDTVMAIQDASDLKLWVGVSDFLGSIPDPLTIDSMVHGLLDQMKCMGMESSTVFMAGHSLGGVFAQDWTFKNPGMVAGQILMGSALARKYSNGTAKAYNVPTLTLDGTLDGQYRVFRIAEAFYKYVLNNKDGIQNAIKRFPVVVLEGVSHMQFASGGNPPPMVKGNDLEPDVSYDDAHKKIATAVAAFMDLQLNDARSSRAFAQMQDFVKESEAIVKPIIAALEMEAFVHFKKPCESDCPCPDCEYYPSYPGEKDFSKYCKKGIQKDCFCGTPWVKHVAMPVMGGGMKLHVVDAIHNCAGVLPVHLPQTWNMSGADLNVTTVSQQVYTNLDFMDTGFSFISAKEIRTKMVSRQRLKINAGQATAGFEEQDGSSICKDINQRALDWAIANASPVALDRYNKYGQKLVVGEDIGPLGGGPEWLFKDLQFKEMDLPPFNVVVSSPMMRQSVDYILPAAAGLHYCKLLSPARALEWIYIDSLRKQRSLH